MRNQPGNVFISSYTSGKKAQGIYDLYTKDMTAAKLGVSLIDPSFILQNNKFLYTIEQNNKGTLNVIDNTYKLIKSVPVYGDGPCHISINQASNRIVVVNYDSGSFVMYLLQDGIPVKFLSLIMHEGSSVDKKRQSSPHPHCSVFSEDGNILFVSDLGTDIVYYYTVKYSESINLIIEKQKCIKMVGCGPRHLARGQTNKKILYLSCELDSTLRVLSYESGKLQLLSVHKVSQNIKNQVSQVTLMNKILYIANRGDDNIWTFDANSEGTISPKFSFKVGKSPRHFKVSKQGYIYVACQGGNIVEIYKYQNGKILTIGNIKLTTPTCITFQQ